MRKRTISFLSDKLLWFIILILPLLFAMVFTCSSMNNYQLEVNANSFDYTILSNYYYRNNYKMYTIDGSSPIYYFYVGFNDIDNILFEVDDDDGEMTYYIFCYSIFDSNPNLTVCYTLTKDYTVSPSIFSFNVSVNYSGMTDLSLEVSDFEVTFIDNNAYVTASFDNMYYLYSDYNFYNLVDNDYYYSFVIDGVNGSSNIFNTYFNNLNYCLDSWFTFGHNDIIYTSFNSVFGSQSHILPIFVEGSFIPKYLTYMAWIYVLHIVFDLLVFIPRLAHKWMGGVYHDDE